MAMPSRPPDAADGALREAWRLARGWFGASPGVAWGLTAASVVLMMSQG